MAYTVSMAARREGLTSTISPSALECGDGTTLRTGDHHSGVAVVEPQAVVVSRHEKRSADVPLPLGAEALDLRLQPTLDLRHPGRRSFGAPAVGAQHPKRPTAPRGPRSPCPARRGLQHPAGRRHRGRCAPRRERLASPRCRRRASAHQPDPLRAAALVASASPWRIASANRAIAPPKRWTRRRTTIPSPIGVSPGWLGRRDLLAGDLGQRPLRRRPHEQTMGGRARRGRRAPHQPPPRPAARDHRRGSVGRPGARPRRGWP